ncbi:MAG: hypothetical protein K6G83_10985 [Lachnospiraceae bacterium]|nr:hypothetical protein [Lachnospiraceae bacterium]
MKMKKGAIVTVLSAFMAGAILTGCQAADIGAFAQMLHNPAETQAEAEPVVCQGSPEELRSELDQAGFYVQDGTLYEFDTLKLASEGKLLTCFGNNAGSSYLILNLPPAPDQDAAAGNPERGWEGERESAFDDPEIENAPANPYFSPAGMSFKLRQDEAVIVVAPLPDPCKYWSYIAYDMFTAQVPGKDYSNTKGFFAIGDDTVGKYHTIFGSIGSPVNMLNAKHDGDSPFGTKAVIVLCGNSAVRDTVSRCLTEAGYPEGMVNVMEIPTGVYRMGLEKGRDTFSLFGRISQPEDRDAYEAYMEGLSENATVFRVTPQTEVPAAPFDVKPLQTRGSGIHEAAKLGTCSEDLETIREAIISKYADEYDYEELATDVAFPDGMTAYLNDANAQGDVHDAAYLISGDFELQNDEDFVVVYGVNHAVTGKARYFNAVLHERPMVNGVCSIYDSMLSGSAAEYLADPSEKADDYYVYKMARNEMDEHTALIPYATGNEQGRYYGVDNNSPVFVLFRIYLDETGVGASYYELVNDHVIVFHKK